MRKSGRALSFLIAASFLLSGCVKNASESESTRQPDASSENSSDFSSTETIGYFFEKLTYDNIVHMDFSCLLEAENADNLPGINVKDDRPGYSGDGYIDISDNTGFNMSVEIPASQYYKITVRHRADSHKENPLLFNGKKALDIYSENGDWIETAVNGIFLEKGVNKISLGAGWSWFSLDCILIEDGETLSEDIYSNVADKLRNPAANTKTQKIYQFLRSIYGKRTLAGQCTNYGTNTETDALFLGTGKYPAVRTFDFIYDSMSFCHGEPRAKDVDLAIDWSNDGGLVVYDWHWYAPYDKSAFYANETSFKLSNAVTDESIDLLDLSEIQTLCDSGKISIEAFKIVEDIDNISKLMMRMQDNNVTVMWRPLHEAGGGWFWWGASGAEPYKWLWKLMYNRMTNYHKLNNIIWVWNAQAEKWYPGDEYCDIIAMDIYGNAHDYGASPATLADTAGWANNGKLVTMSECAAMPDPDLIIRDNAYWLWFAVWNWDYIVVNGTTELSDAYTSFDMMKKVYDSEVIITRDELPDFN